MYWNCWIIHMRILYLTTHLNAGGITSYLLTLAEELIKHGHAVYIISSGGQLSERFRQLGVGLKEINIRTKSELSIKIYGNLSTVNRFIKDNKIDIIHAQTRVTQVMGQCLRLIYGYRYLSTCHGYFKTRLIRRLAPCWGEAVVAVSAAVKEHLCTDHNISSRKIHLIVNGVDVRRYDNTDSNQRRERRRALGLFNEPVIGNIARLSDIKGQDVLINAMPAILKEIPQCKLIIVGKGKWERKLTELVKTLSLEDSVLFNPTCEQTQDFLCIFDIFAMPSRQEGLGLSILEAQAAGVPVIATRVGGIPHIIEDGKTGILIEVQNSEKLARAAIKLLQDIDLCRKIATAARNFVVQNFSSGQMAARTINLYEDLLGNKYE
jgi:glycosyltransferase involved in cell wall biosynthesis